MANVNTDNINTQFGINRLPGFEKMFIQPIHNLSRLFIIPFCMALGNITMDNVSLLDTYSGMDAAGPNAPIPAGQQAAPPPNQAQINQRDARVRRIYSALLAHIDKNSAIYDDIEAQFGIARNGIAAINYIRQDGVGNIPLLPSEVNAMNNSWITMNYKTLPATVTYDISNTRMLVMNWGNAVRRYANDFPNGKTNWEMYNKFLEGLPPQLADEVVREQNDGIAANNCFPAVYPQNTPDTRLAGNPHPNAGEPDILKVMMKYNRAWTTKISLGLITVQKDVKAFYGEGEDGGRGRGFGKGRGRFGKGRGRFGKGKGSPGPFVFKPRVPKRPVTEKTCCYKCGGLGHVAKIECEDGRMLYCASQFQVTKDILDGIQYPHIPGAKERRTGKANQTEDDDQEDDDDAGTEQQEDGNYVESEEDADDEAAQWGEDY